MSKSQSARLYRLGVTLAAALTLAACQTPPPRPPEPAACPVCPSAPSCPAPPACPGDTTRPPPAAKPFQAARWDDLPNWGDDDLTAAWPAFGQSCRVLVAKPGWQHACAAARTVDSQDGAAIRRYFETHFRPWALTQPDGRQEGMITGYYEPLLRGSRQRSPAFAVPVLGVPDDLLTIDLGDLVPELKHLRLRGRLQGNKVVPYYSRAEIEAGKGRTDKVLLWVDDAVELFFLQIQGSGRVRLPDGQTTRLAYADQNGHPYQSIGKVLLERGDLKPGEATMQGIQAWARAHPTRLAALLNTNPSYVFFRETPVSNGAGPQGALGVPLTPERSLAIDPRTTPLGAPVFLASTEPNSNRPLNRLMLAQDTGGAIRGVVRADFFWGFGPAAGEQAGRMKQNGRLWVLLPNDYPLPAAQIAQ